MAEVIETAKADGTHTNVIGKYRACRIEPYEFGYVRITQNGSKHGRRYRSFRDYESALKAAVEWANRRHRSASLTALDSDVKSE